MEQVELRCQCGIRLYERVIHSRISIWECPNGHLYVKVEGYNAKVWKVEDTVLERK